MTDMCAICLETLSNNSSDFFKGHCNHCFYGLCIIKHIHNNAECPICRVNLTREDNTNTKVNALPKHIFYRI